MIFQKRPFKKLCYKPNKLFIFALPKQTLNKPLPPMPVHKTFTSLHIVHCSLSIVHSPAARHYNSALFIWLSVDPMADKYPSTSTYVYCANNPVRLVDADGRTWWIGGLQYNPGESCPDNVSDFIRDAWNVMNIIYENEVGKVVIDAMNKDLTSFCICEDAHDKIAYPCYYISDKAIYTNYEDYHGDLFASIAHEMFHGYQDLCGQGGRSWQNEVEAYWFEGIITGNNAFKSCLPTVEGQGQIINAIHKLQNYPNCNMNKDEFYDCFETIQKGFPFSYRNLSGNYDNDKYSDTMNSTILIMQFFDFDE